MHFYNAPHSYYAGVDLHARSMFVLFPSRTRDARPLTAPNLLRAALARKLLGALWRCLEQGELPPGAKLGPWEAQGQRAGEKAGASRGGGCVG